MKNRIKKGKFLIYKMPQQNGNVLISHAIGSNYLEDWEKNALPSWISYCNKHNLGLIMLVSKIIDDGKKLYWHKLLIGNELQKLNIDIANCCYLDTDIIINPGSPNIFKFYDKKKIALVSQYKNLPYNRLATLKRLAFFRHNFYNKNYPLDSSLFFSAKETYKFHNLDKFDDYACMGLFIFNIKNHTNFLYKIFFKYDNKHLSLDGGGEEVYMNYEILKNNLVQWISYKWQSLWIFEMPCCHSHLYFDFNQKALINSIQTSLFNCYFLHFAGSWEGKHFKSGHLLYKTMNCKYFEDFESYDKIRLTRKPKGLIRPNTI